MIILIFFHQKHILPKSIGGESHSQLLTPYLGLLCSLNGLSEKEPHLWPVCSSKRLSGYKLGTLSEHPQPAVNSKEQCFKRQLIEVGLEKNTPRAGHDSWGGWWRTGEPNTQYLGFLSLNNSLLGIVKYMNLTLKTLVFLDSGCTHWTHQNWNINYYIG